MPKPRAGTFQCPGGDNIGRVGQSFLKWLIPFSKLNEINHIVCEAPIVAFHRGKDGDGNAFGAVKINMHVVRRTLSLVSFAEYAAVEIGATCTETVRATVAKHFTGHGTGARKEIKARCLVMCQKTGWNVKNEDMADALATLDHYLWTMKAQTPWNCAPRSPLFSGVANVARDPSALKRLTNQALSFDRDRD